MNLCRLRPGKWNKKSQELDSKFGHFSTESFAVCIPDTDKGTLTAVIGNLEGLAFLGETQTWVNINVLFWRARLGTKYIPKVFSKP